VRCASVFSNRFGFLLGGVLEAAFGWRAVFFAVGLPGPGLSLLALTAPDPPRGANDLSAEPVIPQAWSAVGQALWRNPAYVGAVLGYAAHTFAVGGPAVWMPTFLRTGPTRPALPGGRSRRKRHRRGRPLRHLPWRVRRRPTLGAG
jgi:MFS family permease